MDIARDYIHKFGSPPQWVVRAPGRVNLIGEHVDYNQGPVLPLAIDRYVWLAAAPTQTSEAHLSALDLDQETRLDLRATASKQDTRGKPLPDWALYPAGVADVLQGQGLEVKGLRAVYRSDLPMGAGLSSSAAVETAFARLWQAIGGWSLDNLELAKLCQQAENDYVGVACGLMDQFSSLCGVEGHALYFDTRSLEWEAVPLPPDVSVVIADSGVKHALKESAYNQRREACEKAVELLRQYKPEMTSLRDIPNTEFAAYSLFLPEEERKRAEHVVKEIFRVQSAVTALRRNDKRTLGALLYASHKSLKELYEVSIPELDTLVELTRDLPGAIGARMTGAGFGGCTVNLVENAHLEAFIQGLGDGYQRATGRQAKIYACKASQGTEVLFPAFVENK